MKFQPMLSIFLRQGRLTGWGVLFLLIVGVFVSYLSLVLLPSRLFKVIGLSIGLATMGVAGYSARASALGLPPPFTNDPLGWRKAKQSYKAEPGEQAEPQNDSAPKRDES